MITFFTEPSERRARIKYSPEQLAIFEDMYRQSKFLRATDRNKLADVMNLDSKHLKNWWQNRRQKDVRSSKQMERNGPKKKPKMSRSTSAAPTPSPTPSNFSSSCSMDQWQPPINQPTNSQLYNESSPEHNSYSMTYEKAPVQYTTHLNHFPQIDPTLFTMNQQIAPYSYANPQYNGMEMVYGTTNENVAPSQYYFEPNSTACNHFSYSSDPYAPFTQLEQQIKLEPLDLTLLNQYDEANIDCTATDGLLNYWQQMKCEFSDQ